MPPYVGVVAAGRVVHGLGDPDDPGDAVLGVDGDALPAPVQPLAERAWVGELDVECTDEAAGGVAHEGDQPALGDLLVLGPSIHHSTAARERKRGGRDREKPVPKEDYSSEHCDVFST